MNNTYLIMHCNIVGFLNQSDKLQYKNLLFYDTISKSITKLHRTIGYWIEGRVGKRVGAAKIQESHTNVVISLKDCKVLLIFNPWKFMKRNPERLSDISYPHLTRVFVKKLRVPINYKIFYVFGNQLDDDLCRNHCKRFIENWINWKSYRHILLKR